MRNANGPVYRGGGELCRRRQAVVERWLPILGLAIGLSLMAVVVVAEGQPIPGAAARQR